MTYYTLSDKGLVRTNNEDYTESLGITWCNHEGKEIELTALILADGMGGAAAGEFASSLAVNSIRQNIVNNIFAQSPENFLETDRTEFLEEYIQSANSAVYEKATANAEMKGMGTTIVTGIVYRNSMALAHVGDSRAYKFANNKMTRITSDHSLVQEFINAGQLSDEEAFDHPQRNIITRALGMNMSVKVDKKNIPLNYGDIIMFCSDGLCGYARDNEIEEVFVQYYRQENTDLKELARKMIELACKNGGGDNISVSFYQHLKKF